MATKDHCIYCFESLIAHFNKSQLPIPSFSNDKFPLFVTWKKESHKHKEPSLRGCIGTFDAKEMHKGLAQYALTSALRDTRFNPISLSELPQLHVGVSLLTNFEDAKDVWDWEVGVHGIIIEFVDPIKEKSRNATYLPEVAAEQEWDKRETIESLMKKAGYNGPVTDSLLVSTKVTRYQSSKEFLTYKDYLIHKNATAEPPSKAAKKN